MLGCQDFCGYYDFTFHFVNQRFGRSEVERLWSDAIAKAQVHYTKAGLEKGLRGLYETWVTTGEDEHCDWTFTLDEEKNVLRWDMRQCPSKGHLLNNDLYADEDYCDHCMGWMIPLLGGVGAEVVEHEHNHAGQCWGQMRMKDRPHVSIEGRDITQDPRWSRGYVERWEHNVKLPVLPALSSTHDPVQLLRDWFADTEHLTVLGRGPSAADDWTRAHLTGGVIVTDPTYATQDVYAPQPKAVLIGDRPAKLKELADRFHATPAAERPLLMHLYLPGAGAPMLPFADFGLPRPVPVLPLLVRTGRYQHEPHAPYPTTGVFALLLADALGKQVTVAGIDLYEHPSQQTYVGSANPAFAWPDRHSRDCDVRHITQALDRLGSRANVHPHLASRLDSHSTSGAR